MRTFYFIFFLYLSSLASGQTNLSSWAEAEAKSHQKKIRLRKNETKASYDIVYHRIALEINPEVYFIQGNVESYFVPNTNDFQEIVFDLGDHMQVDSVVYHNKSMAYLHQDNQVTIGFSKILNRNILDSITVFYSGDPTKGSNNGYSIDKHNKSKPTFVHWTLSEPYGAADWWPCKMSLGDKIDSLDLLVAVPSNKGWKVASNGLLQNIKKDGKGNEIFHWKHRYPITNYLVALAITDYVEYSEYYTSLEGKKVEILNYVYPEFLETARKSDGWIVEQMEVFEKLFGPYPFAEEKYGHAQFGRGGGMEHQTMSFMANLDFDLMAHELAHQWFGNLVTCQSWEDLWINEGFATYLNALVLENIFDTSSFKHRMRDLRASVMLETDGSVFVSDTSNVARLFSSRLTYRKGAWLVHMLRYQLGDSLFFLACRTFLQERADAGGFGNTKQLKEVFERISGKDLTNFFQEWYFNEGYAVYHMQWSFQRGLFKLMVNQTPSHPSNIAYGLDIELKIYNENIDTTIIVNPLIKEHAIPISFVPTNIQFDPDVNILGKAIVERLNGLTPPFYLYPNPSGNEVFIRLNDTSFFEAKLFTMEGKEVRNQKLRSTTDAQKIDLQSVSKGIYVLKLFSEDKTFSKKVVKN